MSVAFRVYWENPHEINVDPDVYNIEYILPLGGVIIPTDTSLDARWGEIDGNIDDQIDLTEKLNTKANTDDLSDVAISGSYNDLSNKPVAISAFSNDAGYLTQHQSLANYYNKTEVDSALLTKQNLLNAPDNAGKILNGKLQWVDMPSGGGGGMTMTVIDYDPALAENQTITAITLADAEIYQDSCTLENGVLTVKNPVSFDDGATQCAGFKLPFFGDLEFNIDFINTDLNDVMYGFILVDKGVDLVNVIKDYSSYNFLGAIRVESSLSYNWGNVVNNSEMGNSNNSYSYPLSDTPIKVITWLNYIYERLGVDNEEDLVQFAVQMGGLTEEQARNYIAENSSKHWFFSDSKESVLIDSMSDIYFYMFGVSLTNESFTVSLEHNNIIKNSVPTDLADGTYLKTLASCKLLNKSMTLPLLRLLLSVFSTIFITCQ